MVRVLRNSQIIPIQTTKTNTKLRLENENVFSSFLSMLGLGPELSLELSNQVNKVLMRKRIGVA